MRYMQYWFAVNFWTLSIRINNMFEIILWERRYIYILDIQGKPYFLYIKLVYLHQKPINITRLVNIFMIDISY